MPGEDVDYAALTEDRVTDLSAPLPRASATEQASQRLVQVGMCRAGDSIELRALPPELKVERGTHRGRDGPNLMQGRSADAAALESAHRLSADPGSPGDIGLPQPLPDAKDAEGGTETDIVHLSRVAWEAALGLHCGFARMVVPVLKCPNVTQGTYVPGVDSCPR